MRLIEDPATAVGIQIPDRIVWNGMEIRLRSEVWELTHEKNRKERKKELLEILTSFIKAKIERIRTGDITIEEGEKLAEECVGLKRAMDDLLIVKNESDMEEELNTREIEDQKRWLDLIRQVKH